MRTVFVVNPRSGRRRAPGPPIEDRIRTALAGTTLEAEIVRTARAGDGRDLAVRAAADGVPLVVAVGGDGTVNEIASGLAGSACSLGVVPVGSGNGFARELGMSLVPERACRQLLVGRPRPIDLGTCGERPFLMCAGFGIDARVVHRFHAEAGERRGLVPYVTIACREAFGYAPPALRLAVGDETIEIAPWLLLAANTRVAGGGAVFAPRASARDGLLDFVVVPRVSPLRAAVYAVRLFSGSFDEGSRVRMWRSAAARLSAAGPIEGQVDGEPVTFPADLAIGCRPGALSVWCPEG